VLDHQSTSVDDAKAETRAGRRHHCPVPAHDAQRLAGAVRLLPEALKPTPTVSSCEDRRGQDVQ
jgi:hypothetical protein